MATVSTLRLTERDRTRLGAAIKEYCGTQDEFAKRISVSQSTVAQIVTGGLKNLRVDMAQKMFAALKEDSYLSFLVDYQDPPDYLSPDGGDVRAREVLYRGFIHRIRSAYDQGSPDRRLQLFLDLERTLANYESSESH